MNTDEQRLARWLQTATPEPPREITAQQILAMAELERATGGWRRRWLPVLAAASAVAVVVLIVALVSGHTAKHSAPPVVPATSPVPSATSVGPAATPPADRDLLRVVGSRGSTAWELSDTLLVSTDAGDRWSSIGLPSGLTVASISSMDVGDNGAVWLTANDGQTVQVYRRDPSANTWTHTRLVPVMPPGDNTGLPPVFSAIYASRDGVTAVVAGWGVAEGVTYQDIFVTTDDGATFAQYQTGITENIWSVTFFDDRVALAVAGPMDNRVFRTADGGRTWTQVLGGDPSLNLSFGTPVATADGIKLPLIKGTDTGLDVSILTSTDRGAHFSAPTAAPLHVTSDYSSSRGTLNVAISGDEVWVPVKLGIYRSDDGGRTWRDIPTATTVDLVSIAGNGRAIAQVSAGCESNRTTPACFSPTYLVVTRDDGRNWRTP